MKVSFSPVFGFTQPLSWSEFSSDSLGKSFFCISVSGNNASRHRSALSALLTRSSITSALGLHQVCQEVVQAASAIGGLNLELVAGFFDFEGHRCALCAIDGNVLLKRNLKVGQILAAQNELKIIEGKLQLDDVFVFVLSSANTSISMIEAELPRSRNFESLEIGIAATIRQVSPLPVQALLVGLEMAPGDQAEPPLTAGQVIADGDIISPEKFSVIDRKNPQVASFYFQKIRGGGAFIQQAVTALSSKDVYIRRQVTRQMAKVLLPVALIVILLIALFTFQNIQRQQQLKRAQDIIQPIDAQLSQIKETIKMNPVQARQQTEDLIVQLDSQLKQELSRKTTAKALQEELKILKDYYASISGMDEFPALQPFYDLRLVKSDFIANRMALQDTVLIFLDSGQGKIIALDTIKKQWTDIPAGAAAQMKDIELQGQNAYVMGSGLFRINLSDSKESKQLKENNDVLQNATGMRLYKQFIYVISIPQNNIFRYSMDDKDRDQLSEPIGWLRPPVVFDLNQIQSFTIDGNLWIGTKTGEIKKFTTGLESPFTVIGLKEPFTSPLTIYTQEDQKNIYVLEPAKERVVVLNKEGVFQREIKSPTLATTTSLAVNEKTKKAYVLSGALIFQIDL